MRTSRIILACATLMFAAATAPVSQGASVTLEWTPSPSPATNVTGYKLYYSFENFSGVLPPGAVGIPLGGETNVTVSHLMGGFTYYFALSTVGPTGEGPISAPLSVSVPSSPDDPPSPGGTTGGTTSTGGGTSTGGTTSEPSPTSGGGSTGAPTVASLYSVRPRIWLYPTNGQALLALQGIKGATFTIQSSTNVGDPNSWTTLTDVKMTEVAPGANPTAVGSIEAAFIPSLEQWQDPAPLGTEKRFYRIHLPFGYPIVAKEALVEAGFGARLIAVRLPGLDHYIVCYVTEEAAYLDYNGDTHVVYLVDSGATIREIATTVSESLDQNWTSASEFVVNNGVKELFATVVKTDNPLLDPPLGQAQPSTIEIDF